MKHFLRDDDITASQQRMLLTLTDELRAAPTAPLLATPVPDLTEATVPRSIAVVFEKESTRSRLSFHVAITQLGGSPVVVDSQTSQLARGETIEDTARVLSGYVDAIVFRTYTQERALALAHAARVPVINALTDAFHPCQALADVYTIAENFGSATGRTLAYVGDTGNNMSQSYLLAGALAGLHVRVAGPPQYQPAPDVVARAAALAKTAGGSVSTTHDCRAAVDGADVVATDTWVSMGQQDGQQRLRDLRDYQVNSDLVKLAAPHAIVLHCLPAHRGEEITDEVMDGPQSRVFDQAENRLHAQKALLAWLVAGHGGPAAAKEHLSK